MPDQALARGAPAQERALVEHVERLGKFRSGRLAVHIQLSRLSRAYKRDHYISMAIDVFETSVSRLEGQLFILKNNDLVFIARESPFAALDKAVNQIRVLFSDPVFQEKEPEGFCVWYRLDNDYAELLAAAKRLLHDAEQARIDYVRDTYEMGRPIGPDVLARLEQSLSKVDMTNIARRQMACTLIEGQPPQPLFEEIYVSIADLQNIVTPGINLLANIWLFQYLTHTLDKRIMLMLMRDGIPTDRPFSINLNVATILSPEFRRFDSIISPQLRGRLVIEFNKIDVFSDMGAFLFARDYLRERGFRLCLDRLTHLTLPYYDRMKLGFDLIKIQWMPDSIDNMLPEMIPEVRRIIMDAGQSRAILCRCETARAIEIGQKLGIVMFQGRYVDRVYQQHRIASAAMPQNF